MKKLIAGVIFMALAGSAFASSPLTAQQTKRLQELEAISWLDRWGADCYRNTAYCLGYTKREFAEFKYLSKRRSAWARDEYARSEWRRGTQGR